MWNCCWSQTPHTQSMGQSKSKFVFWLHIFKLTICLSHCSYRVRTNCIKKYFWFKPLKAPRWPLKVETDANSQSGMNQKMSNRRSHVYFYLCTSFSVELLYLSSITPEVNLFGEGGTIIQGCRKWQWRKQWMQLKSWKCVSDNIRSCLIGHNGAGVVWKEKWKLQTVIGSVVHSEIFWHSTTNMWYFCCNLF